MTSMPIQRFALVATACVMCVVWRPIGIGRAQPSVAFAPVSCSSLPTCPSLLQRGDALFRMQLYDDARVAYEAAYGLSHDPEMLLAIARTLRASRGPLPTIRYYELYLKSNDVDPQRRTLAQTELASARSEAGLSSSPIAPAGEAASRRWLAQKLVGASMFAAGGSLLMLGVLATINNQTDLRLNGATSCAYGDGTAAKCYVLPGLETSAWMFGLGFIGSGVMVFWDPAHLFSPRSPAQSAASSATDELRRPSFEPVP